ncbi:MAG: hypothetical protein J0L92_02185 [Deltaproteobacteria bacterium]|nr:hypothetical protein [Deltaproteobacteria bacterium]
MRLSPRLLSLVAGTALSAGAVGCGGTQTLARTEEAQPAPQPVVVARRTPNNVNAPTTTPESPDVTPVSQPYEFPEDVPVDCGRG